MGCLLALVTLGAAVAVQAADAPAKAAVTKDDPPVALFFNNAPALGQEQKDPTHTANFGVKLQEHCKEAGVPCELIYPGAPDVKHATAQAYLLDVLKAPQAK
jgi:hypothetical protein